MDEELGNTVQCPICSLMFSREEIEAHADKCLLGQTEKPVTRNKKSPNHILFNKKTGKRTPKEGRSPSTSSKKLKVDISVDEKPDENSSCSSKDSCQSENQFFKNSKISSYFDKKSLTKKQNHEQKEHSTISGMKLPSPIDLTESESNSGAIPIVNTCMKSELHCVSSVSKDQFENILDDVRRDHIRSNAFSSDINSPSLLTTHPDEIELEENKSSVDSFLSITSSDKDIQDRNGIRIPTPPPVPLLSPTFINSKNEDVLNRKDHSTTSRDKLGCNVVDGQVTECATPPLTTFQQELFNMSRGSDSTSPSLPAKTKHIGKIEKVSTNIRSRKDKDIFVQKEVKGKEILLGRLPLAEQMRPTSLDDYVGQVAVGTQKLLKELFYNDVIPSMILWGPPGCGKTSLAHIISNQCKSGTRYRFVSLSATMSGVNDVKEAVKIAKNEKKLRQKDTVLFIDEVHRFNKAQQDSFLPHIEDGTIVLVGATTENPSFHLNNALISRCRIVVLNSLNVDNVEKILMKAVFKLGGEEKENTKSSRFILEDGVVHLLAEYSNGDARIALTNLDMLLQAKLNSKTDESVPTITCEQIKEELKRGHVNYDKQGDGHYHIISAFQKSIRGGNADAAIYWLARMLEGGEDPLYISRRLIVIASEDIGVADPNALNLAVSCYQACQFVGMPECSLVLAHVTTHLSNAPKSIAAYSAYSKAKSFIKNYVGAQPSVPFHLRNAPTKLLKDLGYSKGYKYTPDYEDDDKHQDYLPKDIVGTKFFT